MATHPPLTLIFVSNNENKFAEIESEFKEANMNMIYKKEDIREIQSSDMVEIVRKKVLDAFKKVSRPVFVEHTCWHINAWEKLPGCSTQLYWDTLKGDKICNLLKHVDDKSAFAKSIIGYCDGKNIYVDFKGRLNGEIADKPQDGKFEWGTIFIPEGQPGGKKEVYSNLDIETLNTISHRVLAVKKFINHLNGTDVRRPYDAKDTV